MELFQIAEEGRDDVDGGLLGCCFALRVQLRIAASLLRTLQFLDEMTGK
jgi:hypothetical protein